MLKSEKSREKSFSTPAPSHACLCCCLALQGAVPLLRYLVQLVRCRRIPPSLRCRRSNLDAGVCQRICNSTARGSIGLSPAGTGSAELGHPSETQVWTGEGTQQGTERKTTLREISKVCLKYSQANPKHSCDMRSCAVAPGETRSPVLPAIPASAVWKLLPLLQLLSAEMQCSLSKECHCALPFCRQTESACCRSCNTHSTPC